MKQVWYVQGADPDFPIPVLFSTKEGAERYARHVWPDADPDARYARIFYKSVWGQDDISNTEAAIARVTGI